MKVPLCYPVFDKDMEEAAIAALRGEKMVLGESVFKFENEFARYVGTKRAVSVSSGTNALSLAMEAIGLKGKEVLTTPLSFIATANSIVHAGATPRFSDVGEDSNLDPGLATDAITDATGAIIPVHLYGRPAKMDEFMEIADEKGVGIIEDVAQAHGAELKGEKMGAWGHAGCFSFYSTKNMTVGGDGGMITTSDEELADLCTKMRDCGRSDHYTHDVIGYTSRLNTVNAAIGRVQLKKLDHWNDIRRRMAALYKSLLSDVDGLVLPQGDVPGKCVYYMFTIHTGRRDELEKFLKEKNIGTGIHFPVPIHLQPIYRQMYGYRGGEYPVTEELASKVLSLPLFAEIKEEQVRYVADSICEFFHGS